MEEVRSSILLSSTSIAVQALAEAHASAGWFFGGLVAGEGSFYITRKETPYKDGTPRPRFVFQLTMASRDEPLVRGLRDFLGVGSVRTDAPRRTGWLPTATCAVTSLRHHHAAVIPFAEAFLMPTAKRQQFEAWRDAMYEHETARPNRWGKGPSSCSVDECDRPVRGRGLCRPHYYEATGY